MRDNNRTNSIFLAVELSFYSICFIAFLLLNFFFECSTEAAGRIYILFIATNFIYLFLLGNVFTNLDPAVHYKKSSVNFRERKIDYGKSSLGKKKRGAVGVIILWVFYLIFIFTLSRFDFFGWELFLCGACIMFALNSIFCRKKCLLSILFLHNKNNCCMNCTINGWDVAIFASSLIFAPFISIPATVINIIIIILSAIDLIIWEYNYNKHPYRFFPETNQNLSCKNCIKGCKLKQKSKHKDVNEPSLV